LQGDKQHYDALLPSITSAAPVRSRASGPWRIDLRLDSTSDAISGLSVRRGPFV